MKKLVLICILIALLYPLKAQPIVYGSLSPSDLGLGVRIDNFSGSYGTYIAISEGHYKFAEDWYIKDHIKFSVGYVHYTKTNTFYSLGVSCHTYGEVKAPYDMPARALMPFSYEVGTGIYFDVLCVAIRIDPLKWDASLDFGIRF